MEVAVGSPGSVCEDVEPRCVTDKGHELVVPAAMIEEIEESVKECILRALQEVSAKEVKKVLLLDLSVSHCPEVSVHCCVLEAGLVVRVL